MMNKESFDIAIFPGDGIGTEIVREALKVLNIVMARSMSSLHLKEGLIGGAAYDALGTPFPEESLQMALNSRAVLLGAVGGPKWEALDYSVRPERALLGLREKMGLYANLRPVTVYPELIDASPLKQEIIRGIDIMIIRELTGDVYFGKPRGVRMEGGQRVGINTLIYSEAEIHRIAKVGFETAMKRRKQLTSVDKANVLETTQLWRDVVTEVGQSYPEVTLKHMYVDNCAMQLLWNPSQFDVIVTTNLFGDILSDEGAMLTGSIGMLPSASLGERFAMYEPIHGSAPDIAGQNAANPLATILSVAMMCRYSLAMSQEAEWIEEAVRQVLRDGLRTRDIWTEGFTLIGTSEMGDEVAGRLKALLP